MVLSSARNLFENINANNISAVAQAAGRAGVAGTRAVIAGGSRAVEACSNKLGATAQGGAKGGAIGLAAGAATALVIVPVALPLVGFTASGVAAGSTAAVIHSAIGNVAAGSLFAAAQSAGVLGIAGATKVAIVGGTGAACGAIGAGVAAIRKR